MKHVRFIPFPEWVSIIIIFVVGVIVYANTFHHGFVYDDVFFNEIPIYRTLAGIPVAFQVPYVADSPATAAYRPLPTATFILTYVFFGSSAVPFHVVNVLLHASICVLIYLVLKKSLSVPTVVAVSTALLFAVLPIHTEVVANIKSRDELLYILSFLVMTMFFLKAVSSQTKQKILWLLIASVCYMFSLLSKEYAVLTPLIVIVFALVVQKHAVKKIFFSSFCFVPPLMLYFFLRSQAFGISLASEDLAPYISNPLIYSSLWVRVLTGFSILWTYIEKIFFPLHLSASYHFAHFVPVANPLESFSFAGGVIVFLFLLLLFCYVFFKKNAIFVGLIIFIFSYLPISQFIKPRSDIIAERWMYLPSLGLLLVFCSFMYWIWKKNKKLYIVLLSMLLLAYGYRTVVRNNVWKSGSTLYASFLVDAPESAATHNLLSWEMLKNGDIDKAEEHAEKAQAIYPEGIKLYNLFATISTLKHNYSDAERYLDLSSTLNPNGIEMLRLRSGMYYQMGDYPRAYDAIDKLIRLKRIYRFEDIFSYAIILLKLKRYDEAAEWFHKLSLMEKYRSQYLFLQAVMLYKTGKKEEAMRIQWDARLSDQMRLKQLEEF